MSTSKLSGLTRQQKEALYDQLQELKQRAKRRGAAYSPNAGQLDVHKSTKRERYVFSGNGFGKTTLLVNEVVWAAEGINPITKQRTKVPANIIVVLDSPEKVAEKFIPELKKWYEVSDDQFSKNGKPYYTEIAWKNGSRIRFMFFDQDAFKFEGIDDIDFIASDEPMPRDRYVALVRGTREKHSDPKILIVGTPIAQPWLRKEVYEPWARGERPDTECFRHSVEMNRANLRDGFIEEFASRLTDREKKIRLEGYFADLEGLALADLWKPETHTITMPRWPADWPCVLAIDPHPRKKHVALLLGITKDEEFIVLKEWASRAAPNHFAKELQDLIRDYRVVDIVCDSLGATPMSGGDGNKSFIEVLNEEGIRARATTFDDKKDEAWIQKIQQVLALPLEPNNFGKFEPQLKVVKDCKGLISNIENVQWLRSKNAEDVKPKLDITDQDYLACLKYALASRLRFNKGITDETKRAKPTPWAGAGQAAQIRRPASFRDFAKRVKSASKMWK